MCNEIQPVSGAVLRKVKVFSSSGFSWHFNALPILSVFEQKIL